MSKHLNTIEHPVYEAPSLTVIGELTELTEGSGVSKTKN